MTPPLSFNNTRIDDALPNTPEPALERVAQNSSLLDKHPERFDRDETLGYSSLSQDKDDGGVLDFSASACPDKVLLDEMQRLLDPPLTKSETNLAAWCVEFPSSIYCPGARYNMELELELGRVADWARFEASSDTGQYLAQWGPASKGRAGRERVNIIARRNIRRRWERLGVWNPEWGIPGRANPQPNDNTDIWKWSWQHGEAAADWRGGPISGNPQHPSARAFRLRQGQRRGEYALLSPRPRLDDNASAAQAESFIISRPWFTFAVEKSEEGQRCWRLPVEMRRYRNSPSEAVKEIWKERGHWKTSWQDTRWGENGKVIIGWNWPYESLGPEPEELSGHEDIATLELAPSEVDALEKVDALGEIGWRA